MFLLQCTMVLSPLNDGICPSAAISQGNNCFWVKYFDISFTFDLYLGTNWIVATTARESMELLTGMWKDVFWIFGTSWMLCELSVLVNENIWEIFAPWRGRLCKMLFWRLLKGRVWVASVQHFNLHKCWLKFSFIILTILKPQKLNRTSASSLDQTSALKTWPKLLQYHDQNSG